jgi:FPC/CPF motif-containing protein YcgG
MLGAAKKGADQISAKLTAVKREKSALLTAVKIHFGRVPAFASTPLFSLGITPVDDRGQERRAGPAHRIAPVPRRHFAWLISCFSMNARRHSTVSNSAEEIFANLTLVKSISAHLG